MSITQSRTVVQEAAALRKLKLASDKATARAKELKLEFDQATIELFERMQSEEVETIKTGGTLFVPAETVYATVQDREAFVAWAEENDTQLVEVKERKALLNELIREKLDNGEQPPPGIGFYVRQYISQRSG